MKGWGKGLAEKKKGSPHKSEGAAGGNS